MKTLNTDNMTPTEIARAARKIAVDWVGDNYSDLKISDANPRYSDIVAIDNNGNEYCFEVKGTTKPTSSFGATTLTECEYAIKNIERYCHICQSLHSRSISTSQPINPEMAR